MRKKFLILGFLPVFLLAGALSLAAFEPLIGSGGYVSRADGDEDPNQYDYWLNSISKPGHLYLHYNRGAETNYGDYCLWLWQSAPQDLEGSLWGYSANPVVSPTLTLKPMSTHWMSPTELGLEGTGIYADKYGAIMDVDLYRSDLVGGKTGTATTFEGMEEVGFLLVRQNSMDGHADWVSDGGRETYVDDISVEENWRNIDGGKTIHLFVSKGSLANYSYYAGDGTPEVKVNPIDSDTSGNYRSAIEAYANDTFLDATSTSEAVKKLGVGDQIFVASFRDSDGDGMGDLRGIIDSLDYLKELGVDVLWLTPIQKSDSYHGYDISDYFAVDKRFGTLEDYRELIYKAHKMGMKVIMDLVLNHTSKGNPWFVNSQWGDNGSGGKNEWRDVYTWKYKTDLIDKYTSNGYQKITVEEDANSENPSWYRDGESNYYYYGKFGSGMPEINYQNAKTRQLVINMAKYWLSFGLDGYRLDAVKHIFMRDECYQEGDIVISDTGTKNSYDDEKGTYVNRPFDYSSNLTKNVTWWKEFSKALKADYPNCFLVGENFDGWGTRTAPYYQALDSQFSFSTYYHICSQIYVGGGFAYGQAKETFDPYGAAEAVLYEGEPNEMRIPGGRRPDFIDGAFTSNHDVMRAINQVNGVQGEKAGDTIAKNDIDGSVDQVNKAKIHAAITMLNRGISWIYYGDELGMSSNTDQHIAKYKNENCEDIWYRQPFLWQDTTKRPDYKSGQYKFELDGYNKTLKSMEEQKADKNSMYNWYKALNQLKHLYPEDARITYIDGGHVIGIKVDDNKGDCKLVIYINTGKQNSSWQVNPDFHAGKAMNHTPVAALGDLTNIGDGDIGVCPFTVLAFGE